MIFTPGVKVVHTMGAYWGALIRTEFLGRSRGGACSFGTRVAIWHRFSTSPTAVLDTSGCGKAQSQGDVSKSSLPFGLFRHHALLSPCVAISSKNLLRDTRNNKTCGCCSGAEVASSDGGLHAVFDVVLVDGSPSSP